MPQPWQAISPWGRSAPRPAIVIATAALASQPIQLDAGRRGLVFAQHDGRALVHETITDRFDHLVARAGVKRISFHGMRHTHATHLLLAGVNIKAVSMRLGHSSIQITLDTYAHVLPEMDSRPRRPSARRSSRPVKGAWTPIGQL